MSLTLSMKTSYESESLKVKGCPSVKIESYSHLHKLLYHCLTCGQNPEPRGLLSLIVASYFKLYFCKTWSLDTPLHCRFKGIIINYMALIGTCQLAGSGGVLWGCAGTRGEGRVIVRRPGYQRRYCTGDSCLICRGHRRVIGAKH